tara:strand:- start:51 stop:605 length:555 start_codon:yes stop_codon:yes gene_type:complete
MEHKLEASIIKKLDSFIYCNTKTINPIIKVIKSCPKEGLEHLKYMFFMRTKLHSKYHEGSIDHIWHCGSQIILHKFYELKPELFDEESIPKSSFEEVSLLREQSLNKKKKELESWSLDDLKGMLFFGAILAVIISIFLFIFTEPEDSGLRCYMINGEKVCKYESDWEKVRENFEDSVRNIPSGN